jgi:thioredoxin 1
MKYSLLSQVLSQRVAVIVCLFFLVGAVVTGVACSEKASTPAKGSPKMASASQGLPLLVDVGADQCIPCKMMAPILEELKKEYAGILRVEFVDVWKNPEAGNKYGVRGIPTQIFYDASGKELGRHMGFISKAGILKTFEKLDIPLKKPPMK